MVISAHCSRKALASAAFLTGLVLATSDIGSAILGGVEVVAGVPGTLEPCKLSLDCPLPE